MPNMNNLHQRINGEQAFLIVSQILILICRSICQMRYKQLYNIRGLTFLSRNFYNDTLFSHYHCYQRNLTYEKGKMVELFPKMHSRDLKYLAVSGIKYRLHNSSMRKG